MRKSELIVYALILSGLTFLGVSKKYDHEKARHALANSPALQLIDNHMQKAGRKNLEFKVGDDMPEVIIGDEDYYEYDYPIIDSVKNLQGFIYDGQNEFYGVYQICPDHKQRPPFAVIDSGTGKVYIDNKDEKGLPGSDGKIDDIRYPNEIGDIKNYAPGCPEQI